MLAAFRAGCDVRLKVAEILSALHAKLDADLAQCEAAGVDLPGDRPIDGQSLVPLLKGEGAPKRDALFWHFPHYRPYPPGKRGIWDVPYSIVRAGDWKLIKRYEGKPFELFNLAEDLSEKNDLSDKLPEKVKELDAKLTAWLESVGAKLPKPNPD